MDFNDIKKTVKKEGFVVYLKYLPEIFLVLAIVCVSLNTFIEKIFDYNFFDSKEAFLALGPLMLLTTVLILWKKLSFISDELSLLKSKDIGISDVLKPGESIPYDEIMKNSEKIRILTLSGSVVFPLEDESVQEMLFNPRRNSDISILIANPKSEAIKGRYEKDEPRTSEGSIETITNRIVWLYELIQDLPSEAKCKIHVGIYDNYPTISIFNADHVVFTSHYAYKLRDQDTATICADIRKKYGSSVLKHFDMVMKDSTDISSWISDNHDVIDLSELKFLRSYSGIFAQSKCGSFLMQRRDNKSGIENPGMLSVFGGDSEGEETCIETAIREFFEETGIRLKHSDMTHIIDIPMPLDNRDCKLCSYYLVRGLDETDINLKEGAGVEKWSKKILLENTELTEYPRKILEADLI